MKVTKSGNAKANIAIDNLRICVVSRWHSNHGKQPARSYNKGNSSGRLATAGGSPLLCGVWVW